MGLTLQMFGVLVWFLLSVAGLVPGSRGFRFQLGALAISLLFCLGPLGNGGVIDLRSYWWNPYMQPGLFMALVSGGLVALRLWFRTRRSLSKIRQPFWFDSTTLAMVLICGAAIYYNRQERTPSILDRIRAQGYASNDDLQQLMLAIAHDYPTYHHAEGEPSYDFRFAPGMCRGPGGPVARISDSGDPTTHGDKLYTIYASQRDAYMAIFQVKFEKTTASMAELSHAPVGQIIVKESFTPEEVTRGGYGGQGLHAAVRDGKYYLPGARRDLFVMVNLGRKITGTDDGWVYGTLSPDYRHVTSAGQVRSCMKCHDQAPYGRMFGLPLSDDEKESVARRTSTAPTTSE